VNQFSFSLQIDDRELWMMGCTGAYNYTGFCLSSIPEHKHLRIDVPRKLPLPKNEKVVQISAGKMHLLVLR
jgi:hypothetical protein